MITVKYIQKFFSICLFIAFIATAGSLLLAENTSNSAGREIHEIAGSVFIALMLIHIVFYWKGFLNLFKKTS